MGAEMSCVHCKRIDCNGEHADRVTGVLEVGLNDTGEVVINHPDLQPDENGVGHIAFAPAQARNLARLLLQHAGEAEKAHDR